MSRPVVFLLYRLCIILTVVELYSSNDTETLKTSYSMMDMAKLITNTVVTIHVNVRLLCRACAHFIPTVNQVYSQYCSSGEFEKQQLLTGLPYMNTVDK